MAQRIHQLWMPYVQKPNGTIALLKSRAQTFGFSKESLSVYFAASLAGVQGIILVMRKESVMVDDRFPIEIDPVRVDMVSMLRDALY